MWSQSCGQSRRAGEGRPVPAPLLGPGAPARVPPAPCSVTQGAGLRSLQTRGCFGGELSTGVPVTRLHPPSPLWHQPGSLTHFRGAEKQEASGGGPWPEGVGSSFWSGILAPGSAPLSSPVLAPGAGASRRSCPEHAPEVPSQPHTASMRPPPCTHSEPQHLGQGRHHCSFEEGASLPRRWPHPATALAHPTCLVCSGVTRREGDV